MIQAQKKTLTAAIASIYILALLFGMTMNLLKIHQSMISGCIYYVLMVSMIIYVVKVIEKKDLKSIGLDFENLLRKIALAIGIFAVLALFHLGFYLSGIDYNLSRPALSDVILRTLYYIFILGFTEELVFRGYIQGRLNELSNSNFIPVVLTSLIFASWHYPTNFHLGQVIFAFFFGLVLSIIRYKSKENIIVSFALAHGLYNSCLLWVGFLIKGIS